jgi:hypothetical protein
MTMNSAVRFLHPLRIAELLINAGHHAESAEVQREYDRNVACKAVDFRDNLVSTDRTYLADFWDDLDEGVQVAINSLSQG